jgi:hypothetical protein
MVVVTLLNAGVLTSASTALLIWLVSLLLKRVF